MDDCQLGSAQHLHIQRFRWWPPSITIWIWAMLFIRRSFLDDFFFFISSVVMSSIFQSNFALKPQHFLDFFIFLHRNEKRVRSRFQSEKLKIESSVAEAKWILSHFVRGHSIDLPNDRRDLPSTGDFFRKQSEIGPSRLWASHYSINHIGFMSKIILRQNCYDPQSRMGRCPLLRGQLTSRWRMKCIDSSLLLHVSPLSNWLREWIHFGRVDGKFRIQF